MKNNDLNTLDSFTKHKFLSCTTYLSGEEIFVSPIATKVPCYVSLEENYVFKFNFKDSLK